MELQQIEEKIPLKQGLKRDVGRVMEIPSKIEEKIPLKQGLKRVKTPESAPRR